MISASKHLQQKETSPELKAKLSERAHEELRSLEFKNLKDPKILHEFPHAPPLLFPLRSDT